MKKSIICFIIILQSLFFVLPNVNTSAYSKNRSEYGLENISAKSALLIDYDTGSIVYEKNAEERLPIASMTKLASLAIIFNNIDKGILKESDIINISSNAAKTGGSSAFLDAGVSYKLGDLIKTIIVSSANDSTVAVAEHIAGSEDLFVEKMNKLVDNLSLTNTHFSNSTGLPIDNHYSSAKDMVQIYKTICNNEIYKKYSKIWIDELHHPSGRKTNLVNTNRLIKTYDGIEGGKTGFTNNARFCLTASAKRGDLRLIGVVIGVNDSKTRFAEMSKLFDYGFANFKNIKLADSEIPITINTFKNAKNKTAIYAKNNVSKFINKSEEFIFTTDYQINDCRAPISNGSVVGKLFVFDKNNLVVEEVDLIVKEDVEPIGLKEHLNKIVNKW